MYKNTTLDLINGLLGFIFFILGFIGFIGLSDQLGDYSPLDNQTVAFGCFFMVGAIGLISLILAYNLKSK